MRLGAMVDLGDFWLMLSIDQDGESVLLIHDKYANPTGWPRCYDCPPEHERLGPMPSAYRLRCDGARSDGGFCRSWPVKGQRRCRQHQDQP
jgi:hypothetical protein